MGKDIINDLNRSETTEQPKKRRILSSKTLATLAATWSLLFSACSNNTSTWKDYERQQRIENRINKEKRDLESTNLQKESLIQSREEVAIKYNEKVRQYKLLKRDHPNAKQRIANLEHSARQLLNRVYELDKKIADLEDREYKIDGKLIDNNATAAWLWASGDLEII